MAAPKTIPVNFISLPLVVIPLFFFLFEIWKFLAVTKFLGVFQGCIYCVCLCNEGWPQDGCGHCQIPPKLQQCKYPEFTQGQAFLCILQVEETLRSHQVRAGLLFTERGFCKYFIKFSSKCMKSSEKVENKEGNQFRDNPEIHLPLLSSC